MTKLFNKLPDNKGIILIEAILAMGVIVIILTALVTALISSVNSSTFSKEETAATGYAQEGLEIARNEKDIDFAHLLLKPNGNYCLNKGQYNIDSIPSNCTEKIDNKYTRYIYINQNGMDRNNEEQCRSSNEAVFVASIVTWSDSRCEGSNDCHKVELNSCFVNLNSLDLP